MPMSNPRKQIIMNEITFWKKNKMLPEHYCDFLMTLYTEGNHSDEQIKGNASLSIKGKEQRKNKALTFGLPFAAFLLVVLLFAIEIEGIVIAIVGLAAVASLVAALVMAKRKTVFIPVLQLTSALLFLGVSVKISATYFAGNNTALYGLLAMNCLMWVISGLKTKVLYFTISGGFGLIAMVGTWFYMN